MTHDEMIAVIEHHEKGGLLESRPRYSVGSWSPVSVPVWNFDRYEYRPKEEPLVVWGIVWHDGSVSDAFFEEREDAEEYAKGMRHDRVIKMVEVEE